MENRDDRQKTREAQEIPAETGAPQTLEERLAGWLHAAMRGFGGAPRRPVTVWLDATEVGLADTQRTAAALVVWPLPHDRVPLVRALAKVSHVHLVVEGNASDRRLMSAAARVRGCVRVVWHTDAEGRWFEVLPAGAAPALGLPARSSADRSHLGPDLG